MPSKIPRRRADHAGSPLMPFPITRFEPALRSRPGSPLERLELMEEVLPVFDPCVEVRESLESYLFMADLPGLTLDDVEVMLSRDLLVISGERETEPLAEGEHLFIKERKFGTFSCSFPLPCGLDGDQASATMRNGVLAVKLPKTSREMARRLVITPDGPCGGPPATPPPRPRSCSRNPVLPRPQPF